MSGRTAPERHLSEYYDSYWLPDQARQRSSTKPAVSSALGRLFQQHVQRGHSCVDVGCGNGHVVAHGLKSYEVDYVGVDISETAVEAARGRGLDARLIADSSELPFADGTFDIALCLEVVEHLMFPHLTLREIRRVLKPGGKLILTTPNVAYWRRRLDLAVCGRWNPFGFPSAVEQPWLDPHIRFFNPGSLRRLLENSDFTGVEVSGHGGSLLGDLPWIGRRIGVGEGSALYRRLEHAAPSALACFLNAVVRKPQE